MREKCELVVRARAVMEDVTKRYIFIVMDNLGKSGELQMRLASSLYFGWVFKIALARHSDETDGSRTACGSEAVRSARRIHEVAWETVQAVKGDRLPLRARRRRLPSHRRGIRLSGMRAQRWPSP